MREAELNAVVEKDYYGILGVEEDAGDKDIKKKFRKGFPRICS